MEVIEQYPNLIPVPAFITSVNVYIYTNNENLNSLTYQDLKNYDIAIIRGITVVETYTQELDVKVVKDIDTLFRLLDNRRLSIGIAPELFTISQIHSMGYISIIRSNKPVFNVKVYHMLNKKHETLITS